MTYHALDLPRGPGVYPALPYLVRLVDAGGTVTRRGDVYVITVSSEEIFEFNETSLASGTAMLVERFIDDELALLNVKGAIVLDIGANVGDSAVYFMARGAAGVISYEPFASTLSVAARNIELNHVADRVELLHRGLGAESGVRTVPFDPRRAHMMSTRPQQIRRWARKREAVTIESFQTALHRAVVAARGGRVVCKIDCEGCEYELIRGLPPADLQSVDAIVVEAHGGRHVEIEAVLQRWDFEVTSVVETSTAGVHLIHANRGDR